MVATVFLPLARGRMLTLAILWAVPASILCAAALTIYPKLHFRPTAVSSGIVDYAIAVATIPLLVFGLYSAFRTVQYFLAVVWPGDVGVQADREYLQLFLGPFGRKGFLVRELDVRYPFEMDDEEGGGFERFLPEDQQRSQMLPRILHSSESRPINRTILRFAAGDEARIAAQLGPVISQWGAGR